MLPLFLAFLADQFNPTVLLYEGLLLQYDVTYFAFEAILVPTIRIHGVVFAVHDESVAAGALLGVSRFVARHAVTVTIFLLERLVGDRRATTLALEAIPMKECAPARHTALSQHLFALVATLGVTCVEARATDLCSLVLDELLGGNGRLAKVANETRIVPKFALQLQSFSPWFKALATCLTSFVVRLLITFRAQEFIVTDNETSTTQFTGA